MLGEPVKNSELHSDTDKGRNAEFHERSEVLGVLAIKVYEAPAVDGQSE